MSKSNNNNNFLAFAFILMGVFFFLKVLNVPVFNNFDFGTILGLIWPLFLLIPGIKSLSRGIDFGGIIMTAFGGAFLAENILELFSVSFSGWSIFKFFWPVLFIYIGFKMLYKRQDGYKFKQHVVFGETREVNAGSKSDSITFGAKEYYYKKDSLPHGITKLNLNVTFGGAEIIVEEGIQVILIGQYTFGGHEFFGKDSGGIHSGIKEARYEETLDQTFDQTLIIDSRVNFGGLEIRSR